MNKRDDNNLYQAIKEATERSYDKSDIRKIKKAYRKLIGKQSALTRKINKIKSGKLEYFDFNKSDMEELFDLVDERKKVASRKSEIRGIANETVEFKHSFGSFEISLEKIKNMKNIDRYVNRRIEKRASYIVRKMFEENEEGIIYGDMSIKKIAQISGMIRKFESITDNQRYLKQIEKYKNTIYKIAEEQGDEYIKITDGIFSSSNEYIPIISSESRVVEITHIS